MHECTSFWGSTDANELCSNISYCAVQSERPSPRSMASVTLVRSENHHVGLQQQACPARKRGHACTNASGRTTRKNKGAAEPSRTNMNNQLTLITIFSVYLNNQGIYSVPAGK